VIDFASPIAAAFVAIGVFIVAQYFLKLRRIRRTIPSTFLWKRAAIDTRANSPWQRLRAEPLLILQLAALIALTLALMKPYVLRAGSLGSDVVIVIDASLTTQAVDAGQARFTREIGAARGLVGDLPQDKSVSLIRLDGRPRVLLAASTDRGAFRAALASQHPGFEQPDVESAMSLAFALATQGGSAKAVVLLLRSAATRLPALQAAIPFRDQVFGSVDAANLGIDSLAATRSSSGTVTASFRVVNTGRTTLESDVDILADGRLEAVEHVSVPAELSTSASATFLSKAVSVLEARLMLSDALPADNVTWTTLQTQSNRRVLVVTTGNVFLTAALGASPATNVSTVTPQVYSAARARGQDLVVFDGFVPPSLPQTNLLVIGPPHDILSARIGQIRTSGSANVDDDPNGLLRYFATSDVHVFKTRAASVPEWAHVALRDGQGPLILEGSVGGANGQRAVITLFNLQQSDLALSLDFPVLIDNLLAWLAPVSAISASTVAPGAFLTVDLPGDSSHVDVTGPDGVVRDVAPIVTDQGSSQALISATELPGAYAVRISSGPRQRLDLFVVNPVLEPVAGTGELAGGSARSSLGTTNSAKVPVELTSAVALAALGILAAEWFLAMRLQ
jgi:Ca-activated chloride channel family protein